MRHDLALMSGAILAVGLIGWFFWGNPAPIPRMHTVQQFDPNLKLATEQSPYMRKER
jgi:hypothetical protein